MAVALASNTTLATVLGKEQLFTRDAVEYVVSISGLCLGTSLFNTRLMSTVRAAVVVYGRKWRLAGGETSNAYLSAPAVWEIRKSGVDGNSQGQTDSPSGLPLDKVWLVAGWGVV